MRPGGLGRQWLECPIRALRTPIRLFIADPREPLIPASWDITAFAGFQIIVTLCIQITAPAEQGEKEVDFFLRGTSRVNKGQRFRLGVCRDQSSSGQINLLPLASSHRTNCSCPVSDGTVSSRRYSRPSTTAFRFMDSHPCIQSCCHDIIL